MSDGTQRLVDAIVAKRQIELPFFLRAVEGSEALANELSRAFDAVDAGHPLYVSGTSQSAAVCNDLGVADDARTRVDDNTRAEVQRVARLIDAEHDAVVGVGGGRPIDVAKAAALLAGVPVVTVPTQLSADGIASPIAVIREADGTVVSERSALPAAVVADLQTLTNAPIDSARAGIGDLISNRTALTDWKIAAEDTDEEVDDFAALLASCATLLVEGLDLSPVAEGRLTTDLARRLLDGLVLSGLAMEIAGSSRPCSGSEHLISHALDKLEPGTAEHGKQVAFGTLVAAALQGDDAAELAALLKSAGIEGPLNGFGLPVERLIEVIRNAPSTRPGRYTVLDRNRPTGDELRDTLAKLIAN